MSDDYTAFSEKLGTIEAAVRETEQAGIEIPPLIVERLCNGVVCYIKANEKFSKGEEDKASEELQKALKHVRRVSADMLKFRFMFYSKFALSVIAEFKKHKKLAPKCITNYDEQSENFPKIINLIENAELPNGDSPEPQTACDGVIKELRGFLSNFKTDKGELFPTKDAEPKTDLSGMPIGYESSKLELFMKLGTPKTAVETAKEEGEKFPIHVAKELCYSVFCYVKTDKELSQGNADGAFTEMKEAYRHLYWAFFDATKYRLLCSLREARDVCTKKINQYKNFVSARDPKYGDHFDNLRAIIKVLRAKKWPDEDPSEYQDIYEDGLQKLTNFLKDFRKDEGKVLLAIEKEKENKIREFFRKIGWLKELIKATVRYFFGQYRT